MNHADDEFIDQWNFEVMQLKEFAQLRYLVPPIQQRALIVTSKILVITSIELFQGSIL